MFPPVKWFELFTLCIKYSLINETDFSKRSTVIIRLSLGGGRAYLKLNLQERGLIWEGAYSKVKKYVVKGSKKRLEVLENELDKTVIKLNYMKLGIGVIMQKNIPKNF